MFDTPAAALGLWSQTSKKGRPVSDNTPQNPAPEPGSYPPVPPAQGAYPPPAYGSPAGSAPAYGATPAYGSAPAYGAAPAYGYGAPAKTNTLAIVSLIASISAFVILPFIGSVVGVITGHMSLNQLKTNGEQGRGMALAGTIVGWVGLGLAILGTIAAILFFSFLVGMYGQYGTYS